MSSNSDSVANFNLSKQNNEANKQAILELMAKKRKDKKHPQRSEKNQKSYAEALGIKKDGPQDKVQQVLSLLAKNGPGHEGYYYYYKFHYSHRIEQCNAYWKDKDYQNPEHRKEWEQHNKELEANGIPTIWEPNYESVLHDTENFFRDVTVSEAHSDLNRALWLSTNEQRILDGKEPLLRDRCRPWREFPMYIPYDFFG
jgi:hypothetical protein